MKHGPPVRNQRFQIVGRGAAYGEPFRQRYKDCYFKLCGRALSAMTVLSIIALVGQQKTPALSS